MFSLGKSGVDDKTSVGGTSGGKRHSGSKVNAMSAPAQVVAADNRREQILESALAVIADRGFPETRIADVAEQAGISPALVIYYFKTRDQLLTEAIRLNEDRWYAEGTARIAEIPTAAGRLEELVA